MIQTSDAYKSMMKKPIRNRGYISVALGVINQNAQGDVDYYGNTEHYGGTYYSRGDVFKDLHSDARYGSLEQNFTKANGKFSFPPRESAGNTFLDTGYISNGFAQVFEWDFNAEHDIKGLTIEFEPTSYPLGFTLETLGTDGDTYHFDNDNYIFETDTTFGNVSQFVVTIDPDYDVADNATKMSGGAQYLHIRRILCGIGVNFQGDSIESMDLESFVSGISVEISYKDLALSVIDVNDSFDVDQTESFINYLEPLQPMAVSLGVDLEDGTKEWIKVADCKLKEWSSRQGRVSFKASDLLTQSDTNYSHMVIQSRTAKSEFEAIFTSMGLIPDDYRIDDNLASVYITNPVEENTHRDCLQILANATRSIVYEDENGIINVKQAFDAYMPPSDAQITTENVENVNGDYISDHTADENGVFVEKTINLYNHADANNIMTITEVPPSTTVTISAQDNEIRYQAFAYQDTNVGTIKVRVVLGQSGEHSPFSEAGTYTVLFGYHTAQNDLAIASTVNGTVTFGSLVSQGVDLPQPHIFRVAITQEQIDSGETPVLDITMSGLYVRGYDGLIKMMIYKGDEYKTKVEPYQYDLKTPTLIQSWEDPMPFSQFAVGFNETPSKIRITAYNGDTQTFTDEYEPSSNYVEELDNLGTINKIKLEVLGATPNTQIAIHSFALGNVQPYTLRQNDVLDVYKAKEAKVKEVKVKIYTYEIEDGEIRLVDDEVYYTETLGVDGVTKTCENPLISSSAQAESIAKWLASYYSKQKTYDVDWRGDPALQSNDFIKFENKFTDSLVVNVEQNNISFNGAFHGHLNARQAN